MNKIRVSYTLLATAALFWLLLILLAPWLLATGNPFWAKVLYDGFAGICHQLPSRSFQLWGLPLAVCSRCTGVYLGFALGTLLIPIVRGLDQRRLPARIYLIGAAIPLTLDFGLGFLGIWENTFASRTATGALFGAVAAFYVISGLLGPGFLGTDEALREKKPIRLNRF